MTKYGNSPLSSYTLPLRTLHNTVYEFCLECFFNILESAGDGMVAFTLLKLHAFFIFFLSSTP